MDSEPDKSSQTRTAEPDKSSQTRTAEPDKSSQTWTAEPDKSSQTWTTEPDKSSQIGLRILMPYAYSCIWIHGLQRLRKRVLSITSDSDEKIF